MARPVTNDDAVRVRLVEAATQLLGTYKATDVSVRQIAAVADSSTTAIYSLFGSKDGLFAQVSETARHNLALELAVPGSPDPLEDLRRMGAAYVAWGLRNPHLYGVLFGGLQRHEPADTAPTHDPAAPLVGAIDRARALGQLEGPTHEIAASLWVPLHGMVSLVAAGALSPEVADRIRQATTEALLRGWRSGRESLHT